MDSKQDLEVLENWEEIDETDVIPKSSQIILPIFKLFANL